MIAYHKQLLRRRHFNMFAYCLKRFLLFFPTLLGIILISFGLIQAVPGGTRRADDYVPACRWCPRRSWGKTDQYSGKSDRQGLDKEQIEQLNKLYGFDKPIGERLLSWIYKLFTFQFGDSYFHHRKVVDLVVEKLPVSASLGIISFFLTYLICIPLGIKRAVVHGSRFDLMTGAVVLLGYSVPGFILGVFLLILFGGGSFWNIFPIKGLTSENFDQLNGYEQLLDYLHHLALPTVCMTIGSFAVMTNLTKNSVLENIKQQYVLTAKSKGVSQRTLIWKHVFRNSMIPLVTGFAGSFFKSAFYFVSPYRDFIFLRWTGFAIL